MYSCNHCGREYKIKTYYTRHIATCKLLNKSSKDLRDDEEYMADTPNIRDLYDIILEMNSQIKSLQTKVKALESSHKSKQRKINIVEWLDSQSKPSESWHNFISNIEFNSDDLDSVSCNGVITGMFNCLNNNLMKHNEKDIPLRAFQQKQSSLFIFTKETWNEITFKEFETAICCMHKKCMQEFMTWQSKAETTMSPSDFTLAFTEKIGKINEKTTIQISKKIFKKIYDEYKIDIKSIIDIEVE